MNDDNTTRNLYTAINNLPDTDENFNWYLWTKCYLMKESNYFDISTEIVTDDFKKAVDQTINLKGFDYSSPITIICTITMHDLLNYLHYNINLITDYDDGTIKVEATHLVEKEEDTTLYFIQESL